MILIIHHYEIIWNEVKPYMHDATTTDIHTKYCKLQLSKTTYAPWRNTNVEWKFLHRNMSETNVWEFPFLLSLGADLPFQLCLILEDRTTFHSMSTTPFRQNEEKIPPNQFTFTFTQGRVSRSYRLHVPKHWPLALCLQQACAPGAKQRRPVTVEATVSLDSTLCSCTARPSGESSSRWALSI